jgi:hypothetical protein
MSENNIATIAPPMPPSLNGQTTAVESLRSDPSAIVQLRVLVATPRFLQGLHITATAGQRAPVTLEAWNRCVRRSPADSRVMCAGDFRIRDDSG